MTSDYIIALIELSPNVGNDEYIVQCNFGGHTPYSQMADTREKTGA